MVWHLNEQTSETEERILKQTHVCTETTYMKIYITYDWVKINILINAVETTGQPFDKR